jgi:hypothetical protein
MTRRVLVGTLATLSLIACRAETGASLEVLQVPQFETDCTLAATPSHFQSRGLFDPTNASNYLQLYFLQNNSLENPSAITGNPNKFNANANDANIVGFDVCFYRGDDPRVAAYNPGGSGPPISCDDAPGGQRLFVPGSGTVLSAGGTLTGAFDLLDIGQQQALFGAAFDPTTLAGAPTNTATRNASWANFPASLSAEVVVVFRVRAKDQGGHVMRSNWFTFPIDVVPGFATAPCPTGEVPATNSCNIAIGGPFTCQAAPTP